MNTQLKKDIINFLICLQPIIKTGVNQKERDRLLELLREEEKYFYVNSLHRDDVISNFCNTDDKATLAIFEHHVNRLISDEDMEQIGDKIGEYSRDDFWNSLPLAIEKVCPEALEELKNIKNNI
jgi:hypothetical protein